MSIEFLERPAEPEITYPELPEVWAHPPRMYPRPADNSSARVEESLWSYFLAGHVGSIRFLRSAPTGGYYELLAPSRDGRSEHTVTFNSELDVMTCDCTAGAHKAETCTHRQGCRIWLGLRPLPRLKEDVFHVD